MKLLVLVILYKTEPQASESLISLAAQNNAFPLSLVVWDNSPEPCSVVGKEWLARSFTGYEYHHCSENWPLSRVYNEVINTWIKQRSSNFTHLLLLDQDSTLEPAFLSIAADAIQAHPNIGLFLPLIKASGRRISPARMFYFKGFYWTRPVPGFVNLKFKTAINSGMIIAASYLLERFPGYPEALSFYGIDDWFCEQYAKNEETAYILDSIIEHDASPFKEEKLDVKLWRHREAIRSVRIVNSSNMLRKYTCILYTSLTCMRMALKFRDIRFLYSRRARL